MKGQILTITVFIFLFIVLIDFYTFRGLSALLSSNEVKYRSYIIAVFWLVTFIACVWLIWLTLSVNRLSPQELYRYMTIFMGFMVLFYVPKLCFMVFQIVRDIVYLLARGVESLSPQNTFISRHARQISRSDFLLEAGLIIAAIPFFSIIWGIYRGRYNYKVARVSLEFPNLPRSFHNLRIVQISDLHLGSFAGKAAKLEPAIKMINDLDPDYLLFTGDLVSNLSSEAEEFIPLLSRMKARYGKYSILGNHDYGDYYRWPDEEARRKNLDQLYRYHELSGMKLLRNESVQLSRKGESIALIGVENWGQPPFPRYGNLLPPYRQVKDLPFKILMSHDPSHWDAEVRQKTDIDLTLSGHTHGFQFAFRIPGWRWSPVKLKYPRWAGLYREGNQFLYVNIGLGFIGFPGRVGTPPEITLITLNRN